MSVRNAMEFRVAILGASRGLGQALAEECVRRTEVKSFFLASRKKEKLEQLLKHLKGTSSHAVSGQIEITDAAQWEQNPNFFSSFYEQLHKFDPTHVIVCWGGGPFGAYSEKDWKDHQWAWNVNFLSHARLLWQLLRDQNRTNLLQFVAVGSQIAEEKPDVGATSYVAAKQALRGLISNLQKEKLSVDLRLYSPPYMDTPLLPPQAWPRLESSKSAKLIYSPQEIAQDFIGWMFDKTGNNTNRRYPAS